MSDRQDQTLEEVGAPAVVNTRYRVLRELGAGGMGYVHLAEDTKLPRQVAIKTIKPDLCSNPEILKRIDRECKLHAKIGSHPHIVTLYDRLEEDGHISLVMEYVPGETLQDLLARYMSEGRRLQWEQGVGIASQVLEALARIHASGIVHRDIKPSNILLAQDEMGRFTAKLMDFGIARLEVEEDGYTNLTREGGSGPGTPLYMAPEQIDTQTFGAISPATDIYATGVMLYQIISGRPPFAGSLTEIFNGHLNSAPPPLAVDPGTNLPASLADVLRKALAKHPKDRFNSARAFREALELRSGTDSSELAVATIATFDPSKTLSAGDATATGFEKGGTLLDTTTAGGTRKKKSTGLAVAAVAALVVVAAGGFAVFTLFGSAATDKAAEPTSEAAAIPAPAESEAPVDPEAPAPGEGSALDQLQTAQDDPAALPDPDAAATVDAAVLGGLDPASLPPGAISPDAPAAPPAAAPDGPMPAASAPGGSALDTYLNAAPMDEPAPADTASSSGSALDALLQNRMDPPVPDTHVTPPAPEPEPAPVAATPAPAEPAPAAAPPVSKPKPKVATTPKPVAASPAPAKTEPKDSGSANPWAKGVKVKSITDEKVD